MVVPSLKKQESPVHIGGLSFSPRLTFALLFPPNARYKNSADGFGKIIDAKDKTIFFVTNRDKPVQNVRCRF